MWVFYTTGREGTNSRSGFLNRNHKLMESVDKGNGEEDKGEAKG